MEERVIRAITARGMVPSTTAGRAALDGSQNARRKPDQHGEQNGSQGQLHGGRKQGQKFLENRLPGDNGMAQIPLQHMPDINEILLPEGFVETPFGQQPGMALRIDAPLAGHQLKGIARHQMDQGKGDQGDPEKGRDQQSQAVEDKGDHGAGSFPSPRPSLLIAPDRLRKRHYRRTDRSGNP